MNKKTTNFSIKNWNEDDRPREKLISKGKAFLTNAELLAILIGSGSRDESAVTLSKRILAAANNNLNALGKKSIKELMKFNGIGEAKAVSIAAAMELGIRRVGFSESKRPKITSSESVFKLLRPILGELPHEEFWIVYLDNSNKVLQSLQLSKGGITGTLVDIRIVYKNALLMGAVALILVHNHPSGTITPSKADIRLTHKVKLAGEQLDIKVLDHLIITEEAYYSFADEEVL